MVDHKNPKISIIIPVHNRAKLLAQCLDSIYSQKHKNFETIIVDDGSTVNLKPVVKVYPVRYFYLKKNKGPAFARNFGVKKAKGEIIIFIDSDVLVSKEFLKKIEDSFKKNKEIIAIQGNYTLIPYYENFFTNFKNITLHYHFKKTSKKYSNSIASFCTAIKKDVFLASGGFDEKVRNASIEDEEFGIQLTRKGYKILYDNNLQVKHMKKFTFYSLIKQDFTTGFDRIKSMLRKKRLFDKRELKGSHSSFLLLISIPLSTLILLNFILLLFVHQSLLILMLIVLLGIFSLSNFDYFHFLKNTKNLIFLIYAFIFSLINNSIIQLGITLGFIDYLLGNKY